MKNNLRLQTCISATLFKSHEFLFNCFIIMIFFNLMITIFVSQLLIVEMLSLAWEISSNVFYLVLSILVKSFCFLRCENFYQQISSQWRMRCVITYSEKIHASDKNFFLIMRVSIRSVLMFCVFRVFVENKISWVCNFEILRNL